MVELQLALISPVFLFGAFFLLSLLPFGYVFWRSKDPEYPWLCVVLSWMNFIVHALYFLVEVAIVIMMNGILLASGQQGEPMDLGWFMLFEILLTAFQWGIVILFMTLNAQADSVRARVR